MLWTPRGNFCGGSETELPPPGSSAIGLAPGETLFKSFYKINSGGWKERSRRGVSGLGRDGCGAGCWDGKEVVVVGVTSGRALAGARVGRERGELSSWDGYREEEPEGDKPREKSSVGMGRGLVWGWGRVRCWDGDRSSVEMGKGSSVGTENSLVWGQRKILCRVREWSGESPVWGQEWVRCEDGEESVVRMMKGPVRGQNGPVWKCRRVWCANGVGSSVGTENGTVWGW